MVSYATAAATAWFEDKILPELDSATEKFGAFNSAHEGYAVMLEEFEELWEQIKLNPGKDPVAVGLRTKRMMEEATQVAAMAIRFLIDVGRYGK